MWELNTLFVCIGSWFPLLNGSINRIDKSS